MLCCRAPLSYLVYMMMSPLRFGGDGTSVVVPSPLLAQASCRLCDSTLGFAGLGAPGCTSSPYVSDLR